MNAKEVSHRYSPIELAVRTVASLDYHALEEVSNSSDPEGSLLEQEVETDSSHSLDLRENQVDHSLHPDQLSASTYDVSKEYGPNRERKVEIKDFYEDTQSTSDVQAVMMTSQELEKAVRDINLAEALGDRSQIDYITRERVALQFLVDPVQGRLYHALNRVTEDVDYGRVY